MQMWGKYVYEVSDENAFVEFRKNKNLFFLKIV